MPARQIVQIDEEKCNGCGQCVPCCAEGALKVVDGKVRLLDDRYCDGLGTCIGHCPQDAIRIVERVAADFDEQAVKRLVCGGKGRAHGAPTQAGCPGMAVLQRGLGAAPQQPADREASRASALRQWPVQLRLVPMRAPFLDGADVLLAADCAAFAMADFHERLLAGRRLLVGCPKLDDASAYEEKLAAMLQHNDIRSLTVAYMEVPCCHGLVRLARRAVERAGRSVPLSAVEVSVAGDCAGPTRR